VVLELIYGRLKGFSRTSLNHTGNKETYNCSKVSRFYSEFFHIFWVLGNNCFSPYKSLYFKVHANSGNAHISSLGHLCCYEHKQILVCVIKEVKNVSLVHCGVM